VALAVALSRQSRVVAFIFDYFLAIEVGKPRFDVPGRDDDEDVFARCALRNVGVAALLVKLADAPR
jgi:hypothetical protein